MIRLLFIAVIYGITLSSVYAGDEQRCPEFLDQEIRKLRSSESINLCSEYSGKPLLVVNTASHCGFTYQFSGLEELHLAYRDKGLAVLGVPSDDFNQAAKDEEEAAKVCYVNYGVTFTMLAQQKVRGENAHPLFKAIGQQVGEPSWNFNKFLINRDGDIVQRFGSMTGPTSKKLRDAIEALL